MMIAESRVCDSLSNQLEICMQIKHTGSLDVQSVDGQSWSLYFCLGRLVWICGGSYELLRWRRLLLKHCRQIQDQPSLLAEVLSSKGQGYHLLLQWVKQQQITGVQAANLIRHTIAEVLFDIIQQEKIGQLSYATDSQHTLDASLTLVHPRQALTQAQQAWAAWSHAGLEHLSPNFAPVLRSLDTLQQPTSLQVNPSLTKVIDGSRTLRDLSSLLNQDLLLLTRILIAYINKGLMEWRQMPALLPLEPDANASDQKGSLDQSTSGQSASFNQINQSCIRRKQPRLRRKLEEADQYVYQIEKQVLTLPVSQQKNFCNYLQVLLTRLQTGASVPAVEHGPETPIEPALIELCQHKLTHYIGPIASYLIKTSLIDQPVMSAQQLVDVLAAKIDNPQEAQAFREDLQNEINSRTMENHAQQGEVIALQP